jgi:hypothetical protein
LSYPIFQLPTPISLFCRFLLVNGPRREYLQRNQIINMGWNFNLGQGTLIPKTNASRSGAMIAGMQSANGVAK